MKVLITGASGYLGAHIVRAARDAGHEVTAFVHRPSAELADCVKTVSGDLNDIAVLKAALSDTDAVMFAAGRNWQPGLPVDEYARQNVSIVASFFSALDAVNPAARVVFTSSMSAIAGSETATAFSETSGRAAVAESRLNAYDRSKIECERLARAVRDRGRNVVIVNPGLMLGPTALARTKGTTTFLVHWHCQKKNPAIVAEGGHSFCDVRDVAKAHVDALASGDGQYLLGGENLSSLDFERVMSDQTGLGVPHQVPAVIPVIASVVMDAVQLVTFGAWRNPIHRQFAQSLTLYYWADSSRALRDLGYKSRPIAETVRDTITSFVADGSVPDAFNYVAAMNDENRPSLLLLRELASRHLYRSYLMPRLPRILAACRQNISLRRALDVALAAGNYDRDSGRYTWKTVRPVAALTALSGFLDYCYYASNEFRARMIA